MKNFILSIALFALPFIAFSQMEKGSMMAGANYYFGLDPEYQNIEFEEMLTFYRLNYAYSLSDKTSLGAAFLFSNRNFTDEYMIGFSPIARFYFFDKWIRPFIEPRLGIFMSGSEGFGGGPEVYANIGATLGVSFFVSKIIALEVGVNDDLFGPIGFNNVVGICVGLQVHFRK